MSSHTKRVRYSHSVAIRDVNVCECVRGAKARRTRALARIYNEWAAARARRDDSSSGRFYNYSARTHTRTRALAPGEQSKQNSSKGLDLTRASACARLSSGASERARACSLASLRASFCVLLDRRRRYSRVSAMDVAHESIRAAAARTTTHARARAGDPFDIVRTGAAARELTETMNCAGRARKEQ